MGWLHDDRLLWLTITLSSLAVTYACLRALDNLEAASSSSSASAAVPVPVYDSDGNPRPPVSASKQTCIINQQTEDAISPADLLTLSRHPTRQIAEAATKILVLRAIASDDLVGAVERELIATAPPCPTTVAVSPPVTPLRSAASSASPAGQIGYLSVPSAISSSRVSRQQQQQQQLDMEAVRENAFRRALLAKNLMCQYDPDCFARWRRKYRSPLAGAGTKALAEATTNLQASLLDLGHADPASDAMPPSPPLVLSPESIAGGPVHRMVVEGGADTFEELIASLETVGWRNTSVSAARATFVQDLTASTDASPIVTWGDMRRGIRDVVAAAQADTEAEAHQHIGTDTDGGADAEADAGADSSAAEDEPAPRSRDRDASPDEQARRRRRREAIVLNEGNRPLTQQNIIQRRAT